MLENNRPRRRLPSFVLLLAAHRVLGAPPLDHPMQVPADVLLVKGAWSSSSDADTPVPESGSLSAQRYVSPYFGLTYPLPMGWKQSFEGPPPSDTGYYVLAQLQGEGGSVLITAQDMFFTPSPAHDAPELVHYATDHLEADYTVEQQPAELQLAGRHFISLGYESRAIGLHWYVLATQVRCHTVQFVFTSRDPRVIKTLVRTVGEMALPDDTTETPVCVENYASGMNVLSRMEPYFTERRSNRLPVRLIIDTSGKVKSIHFISAFPDQAKVITDALHQWRFKPYAVNGRPVEVETGMLFGRVPQGGELAGRQ